MGCSGMTGDEAFKALVDKCGGDHHLAYQKFAEWLYSEEGRIEVKKTLKEFSRDAEE